MKNFYTTMLEMLRDRIFDELGTGNKVQDQEALEHLYLLLGMALKEARGMKEKHCC